jgi:hypothetical protein
LIIGYDRYAYTVALAHCVRGIAFSALGRVSEAEEARDLFLTALQVPATFSGNKGERKKKGKREPKTKKGEYPFLFLSFFFPCTFLVLFFLYLSFSIPSALCSSFSCFFFFNDNDPALCFVLHGQNPHLRDRMLHTNKCYDPDGDCGILNVGAAVLDGELEYRKG